MRMLAGLALAGLVACSGSEATSSSSPPSRDAAHAGDPLSDASPSLLAPPSSGFSITIDGAPVTLPTRVRSGFSRGDAYKDETILAAKSDPEKVSLTLHVPGSTTGAFDCAIGEPTMVWLSIRDGGGYSASGHGTEKFLVGACRIEVTAYGAVGEAIEGSFTATVVRSVGGSKYPAERHVTGKFNLVREADF